MSYKHLVNVVKEILERAKVMHLHATFKHVKDHS